MEIISLIASICSIIIAVFAVWLSVTFYKMTTRTSESIKEASRSIASGVQRVERLFNRLYSDTFSIMKDTVSDMRKHIWPDLESSDRATELVEEKADKKIVEIKNEMSQEISRIIAKLGKTNVMLSFH